MRKFGRGEISCARCSSSKTDPHGPVIKPGFGRDAPAQINRLELKPLAQAELFQLGKDIGMQCVPLVLHVAEGRADEHPDDGSETNLCSAITHELLVLCSDVAGVVVIFPRSNA